MSEAPKLETVNKIACKQNINRFPKLSKQQKMILEYLSDSTVDFTDRNLKSICYALLYKTTGRKPKYEESTWRLPHYLAELRKAPDEETFFEDVYDADHHGNFACRFKGVKSIIYKKDLLLEANRFRASVSRSLMRLFKRGLITKLYVTKCYGSLMGNRMYHYEKNHYFISKEQGQKIIDGMKDVSLEGQWVYKAKGAEK